jgi:AraC-like DNA-binding protein
MIDPWALFALLGSLQGLLLAGALASTRPHVPAARILSVLMLVGALAGGSIALAHSGLVEPVVLLTVFEYAMTLVAGPLLLLYVRTSVGQRRHGYWIHFLPAVGWTGYVSLQTLEILARGVSVLPLFLPPVLWLVAHQMTYTALSLVAWLRADVVPKAALSMVGVRVVLGGFVLLHVLQLTRFTLRRLPELENVVPLGLGIFFFMATLMLVRSALADPAHFAVLSPRYAGSSLGPESATEIETRLLTSLESDRPFLDAGLTIVRLAARLHVPQSHLSQVVNQRLGCSFSDLMAEYRVREAKRLLLDPSTRRTVDEVARESGFQSRSAFYQAFKRHAGETPTAFRRRNRPGS